MANTLKVITPHAAVIVWNYRDRIGPDGVTTELNSIDQTILSTISLVSIKTNKSKSQAAGTFELELAPTKNWIASITSGSWLAILMTEDTITKADLQKANPHMVKMFGRVDTVRVGVQVDQETGARQTIYTVTGSDWGQIFNSTLYVDPVAREPDESALGQAARFGYLDYINKLNGTANLPNSTQNVNTLINLWGKTSAAFSAINADLANAGVLGKPQATFTLPKEVVDFFGFQVPGGGTSRSIASLIDIQSGSLTGYDSYNGISNDVGIIRPDTLFGAHSLWQVLTDNSNHVLNELVTDIRWVDGVPNLTLYKRVRPFAIRNYDSITTPGSNDKMAPNRQIIEKLISKFENIRRTEIPIENVLSFEAGTNWRDKFNYAEIQVDQSLQDDVRSIEVKTQSSIFHEDVFGREGFRPMIIASKYLPADPKYDFDPAAIPNWKYLLKEWYFDIHNMLNGTITFIGINDYIQVGDNIIVDASIISPTNNTNSDNIGNKGKSYMLAHVENVSHNFRVSPDGARSFITTVNFVRGIITDKNGKQFNVGTIDVDSSIIAPSQELNSVTTFGMSTDVDPDSQKLRGN